MSLSKIIILYLLTVPVFLTIDIIWLGLVAKNFYQNQLKNFITSEVNWTAAIIFYLVFIVGILLFVVLPGIDKKSLTHVLIYGALFGFFTYATYDLTNLATLKSWPLIVVVVDILWGMVLTASVATASYFIGLWLNKL